MYAGLAVAGSSEPASTSASDGAPASGIPIPAPGPSNDVASPTVANSGDGAGSATKPGSALSADGSGCTITGGSVPSWPAGELAPGSATQPAAPVHAATASSAAGSAGNATIARG